jgi:hypothetical protein
MLTYTRGTLRGAAWLTTTALPVIAAGAVAFVTTSEALAEFEIQESTVEKGRVELEYRGALHWGLPEPEFGPLRQSHEFEIQYGLTDRWAFSLIPDFEQSLGDSLQLTAVEGEGQYEILKLRDNGLGLAFRGRYSQPIVGGEAEQISFGPILEWVKGPISLILDPLFTDQVGPNRTTDGLGFNYGWQLKYSLPRNWSLALEMFGNIEDLANSGSFNDQNHSIGPVLYYTFGKGNETEEGKRNRENEAADESESSLTVGLGLQFGLTEATSKTALKLNAQLEF